MAVNRMFRTCPSTGLVYHEPAEKLIRWNAVAGVVSLLVGGILALLVILTRWQAVHLLPPDWFYLLLTAHGLDMLVFWIIFFEIAVLYFCASTLLRCRLAAPGMAWAAFWLMIVGALTNNVAVFRGDSSVMFTSYAPMGAHPAFYLGLILFAVGALIACFVFLGTLVVAKSEKTYNGSVPLVTFGAVTACIIAIFTIASGAIILIPTFLWSLGLIDHIDSLMYRTVWWAFGHSSQQINVAAHVSVWYAIAAIVFGAKPMSEKVSRTAFLLYICFLQLASAHHLLADPGLTSNWKIFNTSYAMYLAVLASMVHGLTVPGAIEVAQREKGFNNGLFEWLRKAPWGNPGLLGDVHLADRLRLPGRDLRRDDGHRAAEPHHPQHDLRAGPLPRDGRHRHHARVHGAHLLPDPDALPPRTDVPGHGQVAAVRVRPRHVRLRAVHDGRRNARRAAPALGHQLRRQRARLRVPGHRVADDEPDGHLRPRRDRRRRHVPADHGGQRVPRQEDRDAGLRARAGQGMASRPAPQPVAVAITSHGSNIGTAGFVAPGTFSLAMVFLIAFVLYYFVNWKYLSTVWPLS